MTPKEKAEQLYKDAYMRWCYELSHDKNVLTAKDIATYICNEILNNNCGSTTDYGVEAEDDELYMDEYFWMEVIQEIKKL